MKTFSIKHNWKNAVKHVGNSLYFALLPSDAGMTNGMYFFHDFH